MGNLSRKVTRARKIAVQIATRARNSPRKIKERARRAANLKARDERLAKKGITA